MKHYLLFGPKHCGFSSLGMNKQNHWHEATAFKPWLRASLISIAILYSFSMYARQVFPGESLWKMQQLTTEASCDVTITQDDIPLTINAPGVYCLAESVSFEGTLITITGTENVVLDLNGHEVINTDTVSFFTGGVFVITSTQVLITNGFLEGKSAGFRGINITNSAGVTVEQCNMNTIGDGVRIDGSNQCVVKDSILNTTSEGVVLNNLTSQCCVFNCKISSTINSHGIQDDGTANVFSSCIIHGNTSNEGIILGTRSVAQNCVVYDSLAGFRLLNDNSVVRNCIASNNVTGIVIGGTECEVISNSIIGKAPTTSTGINDVGTGSRIFNNIVHDCTTNYAGTLPLRESTPTTSTGYWTNLDL